jgi:hypothetical protein
MKGEAEKIPAIEKQLEQQGKILNAVMANTATLLEEHSAQRMDIRSLHTDMQSLHSEVHASKEEVKAEIRAARADVKRDNIDFPIGDFSPPEGRLARGFKPPAFSRFLFQSAVKSAESF